jgi:hypothetical protein
MLNDHAVPVSSGVSDPSPPLRLSADREAQLRERLQALADARAAALLGARTCLVLRRGA